MILQFLQARRTTVVLLAESFSELGRLLLMFKAGDPAKNYRTLFNNALVDSLQAHVNSGMQFWRDSSPWSITFIGLDEQLEFVKFLEACFVNAPCDTNTEWNVGELLFQFESFYRGQRGPSPIGFVLK